MPQLDAEDLATGQRVHDARGLDFNFKDGSVAVDAGVAIPNITDGFNGDAPDLGALEFGKPMPVNGPRTQGIYQRSGVEDQGWVSCVVSTGPMPMICTVTSSSLAMS